MSFGIYLEKKYVFQITVVNFCNPFFLSIIMCTLKNLEHLEVRGLKLLFHTLSGPSQITTDQSPSPNNQGLSLSTFGTALILRIKEEKKNLHRSIK